MHYNIQGGIISKLNDLNLFLNESNVEIVCLVEHWLMSDQISVLNKLDNFNLAAFYCRQQGKHGGACILVKSNLTVFERTDLKSYFEDSVFEGCCIEVPSLKSIVVSIYHT